MGDEREGTAAELLAFLETGHGMQLRRFHVTVAGGSIASITLPRKRFEAFVRDYAPLRFRWVTCHIPRTGWVLQVIGVVGEWPSPAAAHA